MSWLPYGTGANEPKSEPKAEPRGQDLPAFGVLDPVEKMRYDRLTEAGWSDLRALTIALRRDIDWHHAVDLLDKAGPDLAYQILL